MTQPFPDFAGFEDGCDSRPSSLEFLVVVGADDAAAAGEGEGFEHTGILAMDGTIGDREALVMGYQQAGGGESLAGEVLVLAALNAFG